ncbi:MAG TPA: Ig-like domain-containing protein [Candidatus Limnocylindria bacterium]|nr:Ig-like domain-containing protein [Candidatus Limnocylindria bacterium]
MFVISQQNPSQAGRAPERPSVAAMLLPTNVGVGIATDEAITLSFDEPMDAASVEAALSVSPSQPLAFGWSPDGRTVRIGPAARWQTDQRYVVSVPAAARTRAGDEIGSTVNVSFTTETAPSIVDFQLRFGAATAPAPPMLKGAGPADPPASPPDTASEVSSRTAVTLEFSVPMDHAATEAAFTVSPAVEGSFSWTGSRLRFEPLTPFVAGARYAISLAGARDAEGNRLGGDTSFSFTTRDGAQLAAVRPNIGERDVTGRTLNLRFTEPMNVGSFADAFSVVDESTGTTVPGKLSWNEARTHLTFTADADFTLGHAFNVKIDGATDADGNVVTRDYGFWTAPAPQAAVAAEATATARPRVVAPPPPAASGDAIAYAVAQINASRAQYGFAPLALDGAISAVANGHAWDMMRNGFFGHVGSDGSTVQMRLSRAGVPYSRASENICQYTGIGVTGTLNWCHGAFMAEPYPGYYNHIANILNPNFRRVGVGIAVSGGKVVVVWDFAG